jgi:hypothetical protein
MQNEKLTKKHGVSFVKEKFKHYIEVMKVEGISTHFTLAVAMLFLDVHERNL